MLFLTNTLSGKKEAFVSQEPGVVRFYVCGVTVYDYCHIGHARAYIVFDIAKRYLEQLGYNVSHIQNFTDIDDKIIDRAHLKEVSPTELTTAMIAAYFEDMDSLGIKRASAYPKATEAIGDMILWIMALLERQVAYVSGGDVYFSVSKAPLYGKLSKKRLDELEAGARVQVSTHKENPFDFVLWKAAKPGEPSWESPWGPGRPGWHLECSVMAYSALGETLDIHGGGEDLIFPHHENEIAQSECFTGKPFARYWIHNGFVNINDEKMSKSKNNTTLIRTLLKNTSGEAIRFYLLKTHYRKPFNFTHEGLSEAAVALARLANTLTDVPPEENAPLGEALLAFESRFFQAMDDDLNTAEALGVLFELMHYIHREKRGSDLLYRLGQLLGLFSDFHPNPSLPSDIQDLIEEREAARRQKDFARSDALRAILLEKGVILEDTKTGPRWKHRVI